MVKRIKIAIDGVVYHAVLKDNSLSAVLEKMGRNINICCEAE